MARRPNRGVRTEIVTHQTLDLGDVQAEAHIGNQLVTPGGAYGGLTQAEDRLTPNYRGRNAPGPQMWTPNLLCSVKSSTIYGRQQPADEASHESQYSVPTFGGR